MGLNPQERQRLLMQNRFDILEYCKRTGREPYEVGELYKKNNCILESLPGWADVMGADAVTGPGASVAASVDPVAVSPDALVPSTEGNKGKQPQKGEEVERVEGEIIPAGCMPDNIEYLIESAVDDFMKYKCKEVKKESMTQCTEDTWSACCSFIGREVFKRYHILHDKERERKHGGTVYAPERVEAAQDLYYEYCSYYNKMYSIADCAEFIGVSRGYVYDNTGSQRSNPTRTHFLQKAVKDREQSLRRGVVGGRKGSQLGYTVLLNHDNNYSTQKVEHITAEKTDTASALPVFGDDVVTLPGDVE